MKLRVCIDCGCTDRRACVVDGVPCHWASLNPPLCSACVDRSEAMDAALRGEERNNDRRQPAVRS